MMSQDLTTFKEDDIHEECFDQNVCKKVTSGKCQRKIGYLKTLNSLCNILMQLNNKVAIYREQHLCLRALYNMLFVEEDNSCQRNTTKV